MAVIRPTAAAEIAQRGLGERQVLSTSFAFSTSAPITTPTAAQVEVTPVPVSVAAPLFTFDAGRSGGQPLLGGGTGNKNGGIDDETDKAGLSKGGTAAIVVVLLLLAIALTAVFFLYRRGYLTPLQRRMRMRRSIHKSRITYPIEDKINLTRFASEPGTNTDPTTKNMTAFVVQPRSSADSLRNGPQWSPPRPQPPSRNGTTSTKRLSAPLPPTPVEAAEGQDRVRESGALGTMDWRTMNPVTPVRNPFADTRMEDGAR